MAKLKPLFQKSEIIEFTQEDMILFEQDLENCVKSIIESVHSGIWRRNFLCCDSTKYDKDKVGACKFFNYCLSDDQDLKDHYLKQYTKRAYNPLLFDQEKE